MDSSELRQLKRALEADDVVRVQSHYERLGEVVDCTPLGYALRFQATRSERGKTVALLRERGAPE